MLVIQAHRTAERGTAGACTMTIDAQDWPAISALFDQALDLPAQRRPRWLEDLPEGQRAHRHTLESLLADHARVETQNFLHTLPKIGVAREPARAAPGADGHMVGPYRLLRELGRGGMGSVWLAERADGVLKRQVALKLPHPGLATRAFAERLARERDILASLAHPHIARLYDAGVTAEGQPYIALAYVQGCTLIEHCRAQALSMRERIVLFQQVLDAVQYAHAHLVIHRDLKPSNVLVDEEGQVHLLDFGIAKLLVDGQAEATELTLDGGQALTPDYASPEQIAGASISTASDVYSLGVLLYELLVGVRPYRLQRQGQAAMERAVLEMDVARPSAAARSAGAVPTARTLRGDLDTIILKALQKDPAARYSTADAFSQDLQRYLDGTPVLARPDAVTYRVGKFIRRHRVGVTATVLVSLALGAGSAGTAWQARQAKQQAERAQAIQDFLIGLFDEADPAKAQGRELTARQMVDRGQRDLLVKLANQPKLNALLDGVLVNLYTKLGDESKALPLAETQRDLTLQLDGPESLSYGDSLYALAQVHGGMNHHALAHATYQRARDILRLHAKERAGELLLIDGHIATQLTMLDRSQEAVELLTQLLPRLEAHFGPGSWELLRYQAQLAGAYSDQSEHAKAAELIAKIAPRLDGADASHAIAATEMRIDLGYSLWNAGQYQAAEVLLRRGIADADLLLGPANTLSISAQRTLGLLFGAQGRFDLAAKTFDDSVQRAVRLGGEDSSATRFAESFAVNSLVLTGLTDQAYSMAQRSVRNMEHIEGIAPTIARGFDRRLGLALIFTGEYVKAAQVLEDVLARDTQAGIKGGAHGTTLLYLAGARAGQGRHEAAAQAAEQAAESFAQGAPNYVAAAHSKLTQALARARLRQTSSAQKLIEEAQTLLLKRAQPNQTDPLFVNLVQAEALRSSGSAAEAERLDRSARERLKAVAGVVLPRMIPLIF
jgi:tRNA A-37 threonylcarbamoyl transferase component Bud32/tetratricopeptide (TPR) repeat protein